MGYAHIDNLYKNQEVLMFKELYAMEKIHGTSAHVSFKQGREVYLSPGGVSSLSFSLLFDRKALQKTFEEIGVAELIVYGEAYGGKCQKMSDVYGKDLRFVAFDVKIDGHWLSVPQAESVAKQFGIEFVHYAQIPATMEAIDAERDRDSVQAIRNGMGAGKKGEGIVLRPLIPLLKNNGARIVAKHKREDFRETKTPRKVSAEKLRVLAEAEAIAEEWVTEMRLTHVLDKLPADIGMESTKKVIDAMTEDVLREGEGELVDSQAARKAIGKRAAILFKKRVQSSLYA